MCTIYCVFKIKEKDSCLMSTPRWPILAGSLSSPHLFCGPLIIWTFLLFFSIRFSRVYLCQTQLKNWLYIQFYSLPCTEAFPLFFWPPALLSSFFSVKTFLPFQAASNHTFHFLYFYLFIFLCRTTQIGLSTSVLFQTRPLGPQHENPRGLPRYFAKQRASYFRELCLFFGGISGSVSSIFFPLC